jgi:hypothetical protein
MTGSLSFISADELTKEAVHGDLCVLVKSGRLVQSDGFADQAVCGSNTAPRQALISQALPQPSAVGALPRVLPTSNLLIQPRGSCPVTPMSSATSALNVETVSLKLDES